MLSSFLPGVHVFTNIWAVAYIFRSGPKRPRAAPSSMKGPISVFVPLQPLRCLAISEPEACTLDTSWSAARIWNQMTARRLISNAYSSSCSSSKLFLSHFYKTSNIVLVCMAACANIFLFICVCSCRGTWSGAGRSCASQGQLNMLRVEDYAFCRVPFARLRVPSEWNSRRRQLACTVSAVPNLSKKERKWERNKAHHNSRLANESW